MVRPCARLPPNLMNALHPHPFACRFVLVLWIARCSTFLATLVVAHAASLNGTITNSATGRALQGARVVVEGANRELLTDGLGNYRLDDLPAGEVTVLVSYTGLDTARVQVPLSGAETRRDIGL